ncbi:hypothetical protein TNCV_3863161 [Trichonephila clavipes]|uniref:Uncharacterized protein n=1 Tax=Trichonephila clavipes TaxID=2585209 RepID=A0A8X6SAZ5_TRICX|nr:hypothetical protein TNCV_3863161 [Trichonephila clavipes]
MWNNWQPNISLYRCTNRCEIHECLLHDPSIFLSSSNPGLLKLDSLHLSTFSCPLILICLEATLHLIDLASNTVRRPDCSSHDNHQGSLKLT